MDEPLKRTWFHILVSLAQEDRHGYAVMQEVAERTGDQVKLWPATLYGSLRSLAEHGWISENEPDPDPSEDPRRRTYGITAAGRARLRREAERLTELAAMARAAGIRGESR